MYLPQPVPTRCAFTGQSLRRQQQPPTPTLLLRRLGTAALLALASFKAPAADRTWAGAGDTNWSTTANWSAVPANADNLNFSTQTNQVNNNDLLTTAGKVQLSGTGWQITGNPISLIGSLGNYSTGAGNDLWAVPTTLTTWHSILTGSGKTLTIDNLTVPGAGAGITVNFCSALNGTYVLNTLNGAPPANVNGILGGWADATDIIGFSTNSFATWNGVSVGPASFDMNNTATPSFTGALSTYNCLANNTTATNMTIPSDLAINSLVCYRGLNLNGGSLLTLNSGGLLMGFSSGVLQTTSGGLGRLTTGLASGELFLTIPRAYNFSDGLQTVYLNVSDNGATPLIVVKSGLGSVRLTNNTYTGGTIINSGRLQADGTNAFGTGPVRVREYYTVGGTGVRDGGSAFLAAAGTYTNSFIIAGRGSLNDGSSGPFGSIRTGTNAILAGNVTLAGNSSIGGVGKVTGQIDDGGNGYRLEKPGTGTLTLAASNSYSGGTLISGGALQLDAAHAVGTGPVTLTNGATLILDATNALGPATIAAGSVGIIQPTQPYFLSGPVYVPNLVGLVSPAAIDQSFLDSIDPASQGAALMGMDSANNLDFSAHPSLSLGAKTNATYSGTITPANGRYMLGGGFLAPYILSSGTVILTNNGLMISTLTGPNGLVVGQPGVVTLGAGNNYTGKTVVTNNAWVNLAGEYLGQAPASLVADNLTLNGGYLRLTTNATANLNATRGVVIGSAGTEFHVLSNATLTINGSITGSGALLKSQAGTLTLNGDNSAFTGPITIGSVVGGGMLVAGSATALGTNPAITLGATIGARPVLSLNGFNYTFSSLSGAASSGVIQNGAANNITLTVQAATNSMLLGFLTNSISGATGTLALNFVGPATLSLSSRHGHTGGTTVSAGVLSLNASGGPQGVLSGTVTVAPGAQLLSKSSDSLGYGVGTSVTNLTLNGGSLVHTPNGRLALSGAAVTMNSAYLGATNTGSSTVILATNGTIITTLASATSSVIETPNLLLGQSNLVFNVADGAATDDLVVNGTLNERSPVGASITKAGPGRMVLNSNPTFTPPSGALIVTGGTLAPGGGASMNSYSAYAVSSGAVLDLTALGGLTLLANQTLSGGGSVLGTVTGSGTLSPGDGVGTLSLGSATWYSGTIYNYQAASANNSAARDAIVINGTLDANSGITLKLLSMANNTTPGLIPDFNPGQSYSWTIATAIGSILNFTPGNIVVDTAGFSNSFSGTFSVAQQGNQLVLNYTAPVSLQITGIASLGNGNFSVSLTGVPGTSYSLQAATNLTAPISWTTVTSGTANGGGALMLLDLQATNYTRRFYRISSP
jgi:autotransporter-associated beta strand protein